VLSLDWCEDSLSSLHIPLPGSSIPGSAHDSTAISTPADRSHTPRVCPINLVMTSHVLMSHSLTTPSPLPLTTFFPSGDNSMVKTPLSPSRQSFPICSPLFKFQMRSEPSCEQVRIRSLPGGCMAPSTQSVCPSNVWLGFNVDVPCALAVEGDVFYIFSLVISAFIYMTRSHHLRRRTQGHNVPFSYFRVEVRLIHNNLV
jgi:hypothetical protein